jgi:hypothetical protein
MLGCTLLPRPVRRTSRGVGLEVSLGAFIEIQHVILSTDKAQILHSQCHYKPVELEYVVCDCNLKSFYHEGVLDSFIFEHQMR